MQQQMGSIPIVSWLAGCCPLTRFYAQGRNNCFWKEHRPGDRHGARHSPPTLMESILRGEGQPWGAKDLPSFVPPTQSFSVLFIHSLMSQTTGHQRLKSISLSQTARDWLPTEKDKVPVWSAKLYL